MEFQFVPPDRYMHEAKRCGTSEKHSTVTRNRVFSGVQLLESAYGTRIMPDIVLFDGYLWLQVWCHPLISTPGVSD